MSNLLNIKDQNGNWIPIPVVTNGIKSITQNQDYTLTITLNDGTTYTTTSIKGEDGQDYVLTENDKQEIASLVDTPVEDVQVDGASIVNSGVANIPIATSNNLGVVKKFLSYGIDITDEGKLLLINPSADQIKTGYGGSRRAITTGNQHESVFYGLAKASGDTTQSQSDNEVGQYTEDAKSAISDMLNGSVSVSGATPTIVAKSGIRYVCGEVASLDFTPCAIGICDVVFTSGTTPTVLTIPSTIKWANGFDPSNLDANTTYELNIMDGLGVAVGWT